MDIEYMVMFLGVLAVVAERAYRLYTKHQDGDLDLQDLQEIVEEAKDIVEDAKKELEGEEE
tara:strand:+ start:520 stop:702 length:183 start_codon:yes stop_codon:yes gene_type:complete